jgi:hypothetical protein
VSLKVSFTRMGRQRELMHIMSADGTESSLEWHPGANGVPHDLVHLICESELGLRTGFWGLVVVADGVDFRRKEGALGDRDPAGLDAAEILTNGVDQAAAQHQGADECVAAIGAALTDAGLPGIDGLDAAAAGRMVGAVERERELWRRSGHLVAEREINV